MDVVPALLGGVLATHKPYAEFGPVIDYCAWEKKPVQECLNELATANLKIKFGYKPTGAIWLSYRKVPAEVVLETMARQMTARVEKRDGTYWLLPALDLKTPKVSPPFERASLSQGMRLFASKVGIKFRLETKYCTEAIGSFRPGAQDTPKGFMRSFIQKCGARYEIQKDVYVIKDHYWSVPRSLGGGKS